MLELDKIYNMDCIKGMKQIPDNSIDMILCDLPYGTTRCSWDSIIPLDKLWNEYKRITKDNSAIVLTGSQPFTSKLIMSNLKMFREELCWLKNKSGSGLHTNQKHIKIHEQIIIFSKTGSYKFNPQKWLVDKKEFLTQRKTFSSYGETNNIYGSMTRQRKIDDGIRNPLSIISCRVPHNPSYTKKYNNDIDLRKHPTQKPLKLFEYLIKTYSNEGDVVLDNCIGSGTTPVACKRLNRRFIGFEINKEYYDISMKRLLNVPERLEEFIT